MQPMLTPPDNGEELLRERILQQEYAFDEQACDTHPRPGGSLYKTLLLLLIGSAFSLLWFGSKSQSNAATLPVNAHFVPASTNTPITNQTENSSTRVPAATAQPNVAPAPLSTTTKPAANLHSAGQKQYRENPTADEPAPQPARRLYQKGATTPRELKSAPQLPDATTPQANVEKINPADKQPETAIAASTTPAPVEPANNNSTNKVSATTSPEIPQSTPTAWRARQVEPIPAPIAALTNQSTPLTLQQFELAPPAALPIKIQKQRKLQYHVLAGASLAAVDLNELQLRWAPHIGIGVSRTLIPGYRIQAELTGKIIKGYDFQSVLTDTLLLANGVGFRSLNFSGNTLQFLEMPILIKRQSPEHRFNWFAGIRPSVNWSKGASVSAQTYGYFQNAIADINKVPENAELRGGLRRFDLGMVLGMECRITPRLSMNLRLNQGLFDLTHDNFFQARENTLNTDAQLSVQMSF
jgi:hypothetical protein